MITALFFYWSVVNIFNKADQQFVTDEINIIKSILANQPNNLHALKQEVEYVPHALRSSTYHYFVRVLDNDKRIIAESPGIPLKTYDFSHRRLALDDKSFFLLEEHFSNQKFQFIAQVALDISYQKKVIANYFRLVMSILLIGAGFSVLLGFLIAKRGMGRLHELTETTEKITANALQQRINPESWPKELSTLAKAYNQMLERIEQSIEKLTRLSADLAHELRTPISIILGESEVMLSKNATPQDYKLLIQSNLEELHHLNLLIENILFLAQAENPQLTLAKAPISVAKEIETLYQFYQAVAEDKKLQLRCDGNATIPANSIMFRRMLSNLLSNAINYTHQSDTISITIQEEDQMVLIKILDNGPGIPSEHLPFIAQRFYRGNQARSNSKGTGLGLAIVHSIVELHKGKMNINSEVGMGTIVSVWLPK
jgi:two-component system heavy metal sensor histidine kinase CusS